MGNRSDINPPVVSRRHLLTVNEVAQLAIAGVKVDMKDVDIIPPEALRRKVIFDSSHLTQPLVERLQRNRNRRFMDQNGDFLISRWFLSAVEHEGTVHVFFYNGGGSPLVIDDPSNLYPSDALLAKIALYVETHPVGIGWLHFRGAGSAGGHSSRGDAGAASKGVLSTLAKMIDGGNRP